MSKAQGKFDFSVHHPFKVLIPCDQLSTLQTTWEEFLFAKPHWL